LLISFKIQESCLKFSDGWIFSECARWLNLITYKIGQSGSWFSKIPHNTYQKILILAWIPNDIHICSELKRKVHFYWYNLIFLVLEMYSWRISEGNAVEPSNIPKNSVMRYRLLRRGLDSEGARLWSAREARDENDKDLDFFIYL
jgi:hypothetical protein